VGESLPVVCKCVVEAEKRRKKEKKSIFLLLLCWVRVGKAENVVWKRWQRKKIKRKK
jgi:hypothetical protein